MSMSARRAAGQALRRRVMPALGSAVFLVLAPGVVAGLAPWWLTAWRFGTPLPWWDAVRAPGLVLTSVGMTIGGCAVGVAQTQRVPSTPATNPNARPRDLSRAAAAARRTAVFTPQLGRLFGNHACQTM